jgi:cob(I)alamin adenosyltransferase
MSFENYQTKPAVTIVYTGEGKGKTSAALGLMCRSLGHDNKTAFLQFIKFWGVSEHIFIRNIQTIYKDQLYFYKGGRGFYKAGDLSPKGITDEQHQQTAQLTYQKALQLAQSGDYQVVICDEINNAYHDQLLSLQQLKNLIVNKHPQTSLCLTGRDFPNELLDLADIVTNMTKVKHHFDQKFLANPGIDF